MGVGRETTAPDGKFIQKTETYTMGVGRETTALHFHSKRR